MPKSVAFALDGRYEVALRFLGEADRTDYHPRPDATASLHTRIDERDLWANGLCSEGNNSSAPTGTHYAPAGAGQATLS